ncbi:uncharacterized protein LOC112466753, partial [Temnothorax curvispinosus]|uniref:Uncharacterized protein LOC112466753 n=1 Tax=Temnothorax curvispinosus TaxID=300111 RepID=A0A6J1RDB4_9HYME
MNEYRDCVAINLSELGLATNIVMDIKELPDFRKLKRQTVRVPFPMPNPDDHLEQIRDCDLFIILDLAHGYLQVPLTEEAMPKTAIITPDETVEYALSRAPVGESDQMNEYGVFTLVNEYDEITMNQNSDKTIGPKDTKVSGVVRALEKFVQEYGVPCKIILDRGTCFTSSRFAEFCSEQEIHHTLNSPRHPQANGQIKRINFTLIPVLQASLQDNEGRDWDSKLLEAQRNLNDASNATTRKSAFELLYGYQARRNEGELRKVTDERDIVYIRVAPIATSESTRLQRKYRGPLAVTQVLHQDTYKVADLRQEEPGRRYASTAHASQLKVWRPHEEDNSSESDDGDVDSVSSQKEKQIREQEDGETTRVQADNQPDAEESEIENSQTRRLKRERQMPVHLRDYETLLSKD